MSSGNLPTWKCWFGLVWVGWFGLVGLVGLGSQFLLSEGSETFSHCSFDSFVAR